jgi:dTMP kinase
VVRDLSRWATGGLTPDLTILLDVDPAVGLARLSNPDRLEAEPIEYHRAVRAGFLELAASEPSRYLTLDATATVADLAGAIAHRVDEALAGASKGTDQT